MTPWWDAVLCSVFPTGAPVNEVPPPTQSTSPSVSPRAPAATTVCTGSPAPRIATGRAAPSSDGTSLPPDRWTGRSRPAGCSTAAGRGLRGGSGTAPGSMPGRSGHSSPPLTRYCREVLLAGWVVQSRKYSNVYSVWVKTTLPHLFQEILFYNWNCSSLNLCSSILKTFLFLKFLFKDLNILKNWKHKRLLNEYTHSLNLKLNSALWTFKTSTRAVEPSSLTILFVCLAGVGSVIGVSGPVRRCSSLEVEEKTFGGKPWIHSQAQAHTLAHTHTHTSLRLTVIASSPVHSAVLAPRSATHTHTHTHTHLHWETSPATILFSDTCFGGRNPAVDLVAGNLRWSTDQENLLYKIHSKL